MNKFPVVPFLFVGVLLLAVVTFANVSGATDVVATQAATQIQGVVEVSQTSTLPPTSEPVITPTAIVVQTQTQLSTSTPFVLPVGVRAEELFAEQQASDVAELLLEVVAFAQSGLCPGAYMSVIPVADLQGMDYRYLPADVAGEYAIRDIYLCGDAPSAWQYQVYTLDAWVDETGGNEHLSYLAKSTKDWGLALIQYRIPALVSFPMVLTPHEQEKVALWHFCQLSSPQFTFEWRPNVEDWINDEELRVLPLHYPSFAVSVSQQLADEILADQQVGGLFFAGWTEDGGNYTRCLDHLK